MPFPGLSVTLNSIFFVWRRHKTVICDMVSRIGNGHTDTAQQQLLLGSCECCRPAGGIVWDCVLSIDATVV